MTCLTQHFGLSLSHLLLGIMLPYHQFKRIFRPFIWPQLLEFILSNKRAITRLYVYVLKPSYFPYLHYECARHLISLSFSIQDLPKVGTLIGLKTFVNEFVAYSTLREMRAEGVVDPLSERSVTIATYALCGFSNPASIGIQIATLGTMAPDRKGDIARVAVR